MNNIYNEEQFKHKFKKTNVYKQLKKDFDIITWDTKHNTFELFDDITPREFKGRRLTTAVPFFYIEQIQNNGLIYDIGCGWNLYKRYYDNIIGIGAEPPNSVYYHADEHGIFNDEFVSKNNERFDNIMSMNSLHFIPIEKFSKRIDDILSVAKPNAFIFLMFNISVMINKSNIKIDNYELYIRDKMKKYAAITLSFELIDNSEITRNADTGTCRMILKK